MRSACILVIVSLLMAVCSPVTAQAVSRKERSEVVMKLGSKVHLFHSSKNGVQKEVAVGDELPVYRTTGKLPQPKEVGKVRVLGFLGEHYFEAEIVSGEVKVGDIARMKESGYLIQRAR